MKTGIKIVSVIGLLTLSCFSLNAQGVTIHLSLTWDTCRCSISNDTIVPYLNITYTNHTEDDIYLTRKLSDSMSCEYPYIRDAVSGGDPFRFYSYPSDNPKPVAEHDPFPHMNIVINELFWESLSDSGLIKDYDLAKWFDSIICNFPDTVLDSEESMEFLWYEDDGYRLDAATFQFRRTLHDCYYHEVCWCCGLSYPQLRYRYERKKTYLNPDAYKRHFHFLKPGESATERYNLVGFLRVGGDFTFWIGDIDHLPGNAYTVNRDGTVIDTPFLIETKPVQLPPSVSNYKPYNGPATANHLDVVF